MAHVLWAIEHVLWPIEHVVWTIEHVLWTIESVLWTVEHFLWTIEPVIWTMVSCSIRIEASTRRKHNRSKGYLIPLLGKSLIPYFI